MNPAEGWSREAPASSAPSHFEAIVTDKDLLRRAHEGPTAAAAPARNVLALRYRRAIRGYLGRLLRNDADADEAAQEVIVKLLQGGFGKVDGSKGRFRDYLKVAVRNTALALLRRRPSTAVDPAFLDEDVADSSFDAGWAQEWGRMLLQSALDKLQAFQEGRPGNVYATLLRFVMDNPAATSEEGAAELTRVTGKHYEAANVRQQLHRARSKFAEFLVAEVRASLAAPTTERIVEELTESGLMTYVGDYLSEVP